MRRSRRNLLFGILGILLIAQVIPFPAAENPPVATEISAPSEVMEILRTSCYDCHSNETTWPWYSHVIPTKWFVRQHVVEGREHLNFSDWGSYTPERAARKLEEVVEMVEEGEMPLASYVWLHGDAALSEADATQLIQWAGEAAVEEEAPGEG